jgi:hypothetical protein
MPNKLIVAFSTTNTPGVTLDTSEIVAPANYKDPEKIEAYKAEAVAKLTANARNYAYTGTFDRVLIVDPDPDMCIIRRWLPNSAQLGTVGQPISLAVRHWLRATYPHLWHSTDSPVANLDISFIGFNVKSFLQILGTECSLPRNAPKSSGGSRDNDKTNTLPLALWWNNEHACDIADYVKPSSCRSLTWRQVLEARDLLQMYPHWTEPGVTPEHDLLIAIAMVEQLGILTHIRSSDNVATRTERSRDVTEA